MKMLKNLAMVIGLTSTVAALACSPDGDRSKGGFVPENDMYIAADAKGINGGITKEEFTAVIDKAEELYGPIIKEMGGNLVVERNWDDGTVNAYAQQQGKTWRVSMFGGLARHSTITADGFALVICHEIGHHIGGAPKKGGGGGWWGGAGSSWASNEGQADYFANLKCLRRTFLNDDNATVVSRLNAPKTLTDSCANMYKGSDEDINLCIRGGMAGLSVAKLFQALRNSNVEPKFETPDSRIVDNTDDNHPATQCRLDTYFQGSLCDKDLRDNVSQKDEATGTCHKLNGDDSGLRPLCWFKPKS